MTNGTRPQSFSFLLCCLSVYTRTVSLCGALLSVRCGHANVFASNSLLTYPQFLARKIYLIVPIHQRMQTIHGQSILIVVQL